MVGKTLSHYKILKRLGSGGMGEVYLAEDTKLDRTVAIKILPMELSGDPERMRRFVQEAKAASALKHANVASIHELGESDGVHFIAMEHVEGETLDAKVKHHPLSSTEILNIAMQVADALDEAQSRGITHRDIKSANIMVTERGQVKVLDFGLAKVSYRPPQAEVSSLETKTGTSPGIVVGTVQYMSPEQALGKPVDPRSDIFSLGVVLYQMATGRLPFSGATTTETITHILQSQPEAIARFNYNIDPELERIIRKCMEKDLERRYQSARDLLIDLKNRKRDSESGAMQTGTRAGLRPAATRSKTFAIAVIALATITAGAVLYYLKAHRGSTIHSLAVLPFVNTTGDPKTEYLSDGLTDSTISNLSQLPGLKVMARSTVFSYKGKNVDPRKVGHDLNVGAVLAGTMNQQGDELIISAELVNVEDGSQIWGQQYNRKLTDLLELQKEISREISEQLKLKLTSEDKQKVTKSYTDNPEAYQFYLKGRYYWNKRTEEGFERAIECFHQAIDKDPKYALAYSGLADSYALQGNYAFIPPGEGFPKAKAAAAKALEIDETLAEAHASLAFTKAAYDWDWAGAEKEFRRALELNPNYSTAHRWYAVYLSWTGRVQESITEGKRALELDPLSLIQNADLGWILYFARQYDQALEQLRKTLDLDPNFVRTYENFGLVYEQKKMYPEQITALQKAIQLSPDALRFRAQLARAYAISGKRAEAQHLLDELKELSNKRYVSKYEIALVYAGLGQNDQAFEWLEKAYQEHDGGCSRLKVDARLDSLRSDPRFSDLIRRMNFPQ